MKLFNRPKDERIQAQMGSIYKVGFWVMGIIILVDLYLRISSQQFTDGVEIPVLEVVGLVGGFLYVCVQMVRKGIFDDDLRYADTETLPIGYCLRISAIGSFLASTLLVGGRVYNEIIYNGLAEVTWLGDIALFVGYTWFLLVFTLAVLCLSWVAAKRRRDRDGGE